jgi:hypothetical protein
MKTPDTASLEVADRKYQVDVLDKLVESIQMITKDDTVPALESAIGDLFKSHAQFTTLLTGLPFTLDADAQPETDPVREKLRSMFTIDEVYDMTLGELVERMTNARDGQLSTTATFQNLEDYYRKKYAKQVA